MMRQLGETDDERMHRKNECPLSGASKEMLGITPSSPNYPSKCESSDDGSDVEGDGDNEVVEPMALVLLGEDEDEFEALASVHFEDDQPEYDPDGSN